MKLSTAWNVELACKKEAFVLSHTLLYKRFLMKIRLAHEGSWRGSWWCFVLGWVFPLGSMPDRVSLILFPLQPIFCRVLTNGWTIIGPKNKSSSGCSYLSFRRLYFMPASAYLMVIWGKNIIPLTIIPSKALGSLHPYQKTFSNFTLWYLHFQIWKIKWWFWKSRSNSSWIWPHFCSFS